MKKRWIVLAAAAAAGVLLLTACTSKENMDSAAVGTSAGTADGQANNTGIQTQGGADTAGTSAGTTGTSAGTSGASAGTSGASADSSGTTPDAGGTSAGTSADGSQGTVSSDTSPTQIGEPIEDGGPVGEVIPDEYLEEDGAEAQTSVSEDIWSGTYSSETETVTVTYINEESLSFAFSQSGISGTAAIDGDQAVYKGDDYHVVVFGLSGDTINVSVSSEEDFDAAGSPLIGTYVRES